MGKMVPRVVIALLPWMVHAAPAWALDYEYDAPQECPQQAEFVADTTRRLRHPEQSSWVQRVVVTVVRRELYEAQVVLHEPGFEPVGRELSAADCAQALQALALVTALALDDRVRQRHAALVPNAPAIVTETPPAVLPPAPADEPERPLPSSPEPVVEAPRPAASPRTRPAPPSSPDERSRPAQPEVDLAAVDFRGAARLGGFVATGYAPRVSLGPLVGGALRHSVAELWLTGFYGVGTEAEKDGLGARFSVFGGRVEPCYVHSFAARVVGLGCASVELTGVWARGLEGDAVVETHRSVAPFWAAGVVAGLRGRVSSQVGLSGRLGAALPLDGHRFRFSNANGNLHEYPPVTFRLETGLDYLW